MPPNHHNPLSVFGYNYVTRFTSLDHSRRSSYVRFGYLDKVQENQKGITRKSQQIRIPSKIELKLEELPKTQNRKS